MITPIVIAFPDVVSAQQGLAVLKELRAEGIIELYASAVLAKDTSGTVSLSAVDEGPFGITVGAPLGGALGLPAGPLGAVLGAASGATLGALHEMHQDHSHSRLFQQAVGQVPPGWTALVVELAEFGEARLEVRMSAIGGLVLRDAHSEAEYQLELRRIQETRARISDVWADYEAAVAEAAAVRDAQLDLAQAKLAHSSQRLKLLEVYMRAQIDSRSAQLQQ